jgi:hypothetical protein
MAKNIKVSTTEKLSIFSGSVLDGTVFETLGYRTAGDGGGAKFTLQPSGYVALAGDVTLANGRVAQLQIDGVLNILWFGADEGLADNAPYIQAAIDRASSSVTGGNIYSPAGNYYTQDLLITHDNITLSGDGARSTTWLSDSLTGCITVEHRTSPGTSFIYNFCMHNMSLRAKANKTSGAGLLLNKLNHVHISACMITDFYEGVVMQGGLNSHYSNVDIFSARSSAPVSWTGVKVGSSFFRLQEDVGGGTPTAVFVVNCNWRRTESVDYVENGVVINSVDGLFMSNTHIMGVDNADMLIYPDNGDQQITGIEISNTWFDNNSDYGCYIKGASTASFGRVVMSGIRTLGQRKDSFYVAAGSDCQGLLINGGTILKASENGVAVNGGGNHMFNNLEFAACNTTSTANSGGVVVGADADSVMVKGCIFTENGLAEVSTNMKGIYTTVTSTTRVNADGCYFDLTDVDVKDSSSVNDDNSYINCQTTKASTATAIGGTASLVIPEFGDVVYVNAGLNFDNMTGRWDNRVVTLVFSGASTLTHSANMTLAGSVNFVASAGDTITLVKKAGASTWGEVSRTEL